MTSRKNGQRLVLPVNLEESNYHVLQRVCDVNYRVEIGYTGYIEEDIGVVGCIPVIYFVEPIDGNIRTKRSKGSEIEMIFRSTMKWKIIPEYYEGSVCVMNINH